MSLTKYEKSVILLILIVGLIGGVLLAYFQFPPIISSVFISIGIATLVYHFLGGIDAAEFNMGPIKLSGSIAALIASAWVINGQLEDQSTTSGEVSINSRYEVYGADNKFLGKLNLDDYQVSLNQGLGISLNDSIRLGGLGAVNPQLIDDYRVQVLDSIELGKIKATDFQDLGLFANFTMKKYTEVKYNLQLRPFKASRNDAYWDSRADNLDLENIYKDLPLAVQPVFKDGADRTEIKIKKDGTTEHHLLVRSDPFTVICAGASPDLYIIRIGGLVKTRDKESFDNYVVYQIFGFSRTI